MDWIFREAEYSDVNAICHGLEAAFIPLLEQYYKNGFYPYFANRKWIQDKMTREFVYICQIGNKVAGGIILCKDPDRQHLKLHTVYVDEAFRRRGIGTFLIKNAETRHRDAVLWRLETMADLTGNIALYEKLGYKPYGKPKLVNDRVTIVYYNKVIGEQS